MNKLVCYINDESFILDKGSIEVIQESVELLLLFLNKYDVEYKTGKGWIVFVYDDNTYKIFHTSCSKLEEVMGIKNFINKLKRDILYNYECLLEDKVGTIFYINSFGIDHLTVQCLVELIKYWTLKTNEDYIVAELTNELLKRGDADEFLQQIK